jgi:hypothetical protein
MPDIYASITAADVATLERLAGALELRAADLLRRGILNEFVSQITFPKEASRPWRGLQNFLRRRPDKFGLIKMRSTQAHSGLWYRERAQLRPQIVPWSILCRADVY